jgi:hypothetical protein
MAKARDRTIRNQPAATRPFMVLEDIPHSVAWRLITTPCCASAVRSNAAKPSSNVIA